MLFRSTGHVSTWPEPQPFVLADPVPARYAMLRIRSVHGPDDGRLALGEWKVIASPGWSLPSLPRTISGPALGGHVVRFGPPGLDQGVGPRVLTADDGWADQVVGGETFEVVIGFRHDRVARIDRLRWTDVVGSDPAHRKIGRAHV